MAEKRDKDIWEKISDAASSAGKVIGGEYGKLKLSHEIWNRRRDLTTLYAKLGKVIYERYLTHDKQVDDELKRICGNIDDLRDEITRLIKHRDEMQTSKAGSDAPDEPQVGDGGELEFLDEEDITGFCPECGGGIEHAHGMGPRYCMRCGHKLPTE